MMDEAVLRVLKEYEARIERERPVLEALLASPGPQVQKRRDEFLLAVGPDTATVLNILAKSAKAKTILEVGSSYGYSTIFLAEAARATGGKVISLELVEDKVRYARERLAQAQLDKFVDFRIGSALETLSALPGPFDFVLVDLWKDLYVPCLELIYDKLPPGALVAADNMLFPEGVRADAERYQRRVRELEFDTLLLPVGSGVELSRRR
jgi:predicted O-methyltransferase YrrM